MRLLSFKPVCLLTVLILLFATGSEVIAESKRGIPFPLGDQPGGASTWTDYRGPEFAGYAAIGKNPLWYRIAVYAAVPKLIDNYDVEVLSQLWIAEFHRDVMQNTGDRSSRLPKLSAAEMPYYANIANVLPEESNTKNGALISAVSQEKRVTNLEVTSQAIELVRRYSRYIEPIKRGETFRKVDKQLRAELVELVGDEAVTALETDYHHKSKHLQTLTTSNLDELLRFSLPTKTK